MRYFVAFCSFLLMLAQPALAASSPAMQTFEQQLAALIQSRSGDYGVAALDLKTGELISVRGDQPFPMASTVKIAVAANYLAQVEHGRRSLDDRIGGRSARSLIEAMMIRSDNHATDILMRDLGGPRTLHNWLTPAGRHRHPHRSQYRPASAQPARSVGRQGFRARPRRWSSC